MIKQKYLWISLILILMTATAKAKDFNRPSNVKSQLRQNSFLEWLISIFQRPPFNLIPPLTQPTTPATTPLKECPPCSCGTPNNITRIVGGEETKQLQYPWMALLTSSGQAYCGGALISDSYVVTAAHCLRGFSASSMVIRLLVHDRNENTTKEIDRKVSKIVEHEDYDEYNIYNDIGVIQLAEPVEFSDILRPVCMPSPNETYTGETGIATGWGAISEGGPQADKLMQVSLPIISNEECIKKYGSRRIIDTMLCAGFDEGNKDACQGDSGGPFHVYMENLNIYNLVGVVSWGAGCARPDKPGVYTRVSKYLDWLAVNTQDSCGCQPPTERLKFF